MEQVEQVVIMVARDVRGGEMWGAYRCADRGLAISPTDRKSETRGAQ